MKTNSQKRKEELSRYIKQLMTFKGYNQTDLARRCGKTQTWVSKKLSKCGFDAGELIDVLKVLDADPTEVGRIMVGK